MNDLPLACSDFVGTGYIQCSTCFPNILRDVHDSNYYCKCNNVQGRFSWSSNPLGWCDIIVPPRLFQGIWNFYCTILLYNVQDWSGQNASSIASEVCGFITVLSGTIILHATREQETATASGTNTWLYYLSIQLSIHIMFMHNLHIGCSCCNDEIKVSNFICKVCQHF